MTITLWRQARLATMAGTTPWGWIDRGALLTEDDRLRWVGPEPELPAGVTVDAEHDLGGALVTPGLIDCHTHLVYGGHRARECEQRLQGASYEEIARAGGGIRATVAATRAASDDLLLESARARALALMAEGVTAIEIKSGYGLNRDDEARCLRVARRLGHEGVEARGAAGRLDGRGHATEEALLGAGREVEDALADRHPDPRLGILPATEDAEGKVLDREVRRRVFGGFDPATQVGIVGLVGLGNHRNPRLSRSDTGSAKEHEPKDAAKSFRA